MKVWTGFNLIKIGSNFGLLCTRKRTFYFLTNREFLDHPSNDWLLEKVSVPLISRTFPTPYKVLCKVRSMAEELTCIWDTSVKACRPELILKYNVTSLCNSTVSPSMYSLLSRKYVRAHSMLGLDFPHQVISQWLHYQAERLPSPKNKAYIN
jgi:hypothetical protein